LRAAHFVALLARADGNAKFAQLSCKSCLQTAQAPGGQRNRLGPIVRLQPISTVKAGLGSAEARFSGGPATGGELNSRF
jgi:hypothetical protein